jgi:hypothetical protein
MIQNHGNDQDNGVMLTVDACSYSANMLELAVAIAASKHGHLRGLFVEDEGLLQVAELPFSREISFTTGREHPTDLQRMQRSLQALAAQFKSALQRSAQAFDVSWSYDYVRGRREDIGFIQPYVAFTIFGQSLLRRSDAKPRSNRHRVLVLDNNSPNLLQALQVLLQRFKHEQTEITQVRNQQLPGTSLLEQLNQPGNNVAMITTDHANLDAILSARAHEFEYAILSRGENPETQRQVIHSLYCPVILVS